MATTRKYLFAPVAFGLLVGCGVPQAPTQTPSAPAATTANQPAAAPATPVVEMVKGYTHRAEVSLFRVGSGATRVSRQLMSRTIGSEGVFAVHELNGATLAVPNASARVLSLPPMFDNAQAHNQHTMNYFIQAGIPKDQIAGVSTNYEGIGGGSLDEATETTSPKIIGYYSVLQRTIEGIPVPDSYAFARFASDSSVAIEGVYWPDVPRHVVDEAKQMRDALSDPVRGPAMHALLPAGAPVQVAIRHTAEVEHVATAAHASYDVLLKDKDKGAYHRHFNASGIEIKRPDTSDQAVRLGTRQGGAELPHAEEPAVFSP